MSAHQETVGNEIVNRVTTEEDDKDDDDVYVDDLDQDEDFSAGNYVEYCNQMTELKDNITDSSEDDAETGDESIDAVADKFTEGHFIEDTADHTERRRVY